jgi:23S rRNA (cytosine1962-C5)-methyltransferase
VIRSVEFNSKGKQKVRSNNFSLFKSDIENSLKGFTPGEWVFLKDIDAKNLYLGFVNPLVQDYFIAVNVVKRLEEKPNETIVESYIENQIQESIKKRSLFKSYEGNSRLVYGSADGLPGLVVDCYSNCCLVQINTAGMDKFREKIRKLLYDILKVEIVFLDKPSQRSKEFLPHYREEVSLEKITILENEFEYNMPMSAIQKVGWYYDHRENRRKLEGFLAGYLGKKERGLDLFCYAGSWGLHLLRSGLKNVDFVDQADMKSVISSNIENNNLKNEGSFFRDDVFMWIDKAVEDGLKYDVVVSDPPAFAKSKEEIKSAIEGYKKLHRKVLKISNNNSLVAFASCTFYINQSDFFDTIVHAAGVEKRKIQILDSGIQGWDHPIDNYNSKSNYIKYYLVRVE